MNEIVIVGSGFSALIAYFKFIKNKPIILSAENKNIIYKKFIKRNVLNSNKLFSKKSVSYGNLSYNIKSHTKIHDRLTFGGNTNIWGGFVNINLIPKNLITSFKNCGIKFEELSLKKNGYLSNENGLRQLRNSKNKIIDASTFIENKIDAYLHSFEITNKGFRLNYYCNNSKNLKTINTKKLFLGISFPQFLDLLIRSKLLNYDVNIKISEFDHNFKLNFNNKIIANNTITVKYDLIRSIKHFVGYQYSLDNFLFSLPPYIDQTFLSKKRLLNLKLNFKKKLITQISNSKFGDSIHYCDLYINDQKANKFLEQFSKNLYGISMPFVEQKIPGPVSNDLIENIWKKY